MLQTGIETMCSHFPNARQLLCPDVTSVFYFALPAANFVANVLRKKERKKKKKRNIIRLYERPLGNNSRQASYLHTSGVLSSDPINRHSVNSFSKCDVKLIWGNLSHNLFSWVSFGFLLHNRQNIFCVGQLL